MTVSSGKNSRCVLVADLHGNIAHYNALKKVVAKEDISFVFLAGDLLPKEGGLWHPGNTVRTIQAQRAFLEEFLINYLRDLSRRAYIYAIFGNDDFKSNYGFVHGINEKVTFMNKEIARLSTPSQKLYVAGYPQVVLTPFLQKDWEQWDDVVGIISHKVYKIEGYDSYGGKHHPISFERNADGRSTIAADLDELARKSDPRKTIYLMHEAPFNTPLDQVAQDNPFLKDGITHVGSKAVRLFIETEQPLFTMHGHFHETFRESGAFRWDCKNSISVTPSNDHKSDTLAYLIFDLENLDSISRCTQKI